MNELERIAPRLYKAHKQEAEYQSRLHEARRKGAVPMDIAVEEMARSMRAAAKAMNAMFKTWKGQL